MDFFSKEEADVIGEISNISIGSSATAMNLMLGHTHRDCSVQIC